MYTLEQIIDLHRRYGIQHRVGIRGEFAFLEGVLIFIAMLILGMWWYFISEKLSFLMQYIVGAIPVVAMVALFSFVIEHIAIVLAVLIASVIAMAINEIVSINKNVKFKKRRLWVNAIPDFMVVCSVVTLFLEIYLLIKF